MVHKQMLFNSNHKQNMEFYRKLCFARKESLIVHFAAYLCAHKQQLTTPSTHLSLFLFLFGFRRIDFPIISFSIRRFDENRNEKDVFVSYLSWQRECDQKCPVCAVRVWLRMCSCNYSVTNSKL